MFPQLTEALAQERVRDFHHAAEVGRRAKLARQARRSHAVATARAAHPVAALRSLTAARRTA
jgi:hypothetical protein